MNSFIYNDCIYEVVVIKKNNKNTYIRIKDNKIVITTNYFTSKRYIEKLIKDNYNTIIKMIDKSIRIHNKEGFFIFGCKYNVIYKDINDIIINGNNIYTKDSRMLNNWLDNYIKNIFKKRIDYNYNLFEEVIPYPKLRLRSMRSRWGVCNIKTNVITLNKELIRYDIKCLDYVCIHELAHLLEGNHSKKFWNIVSKYCSNYKEIRKEMRG